MPEERPSSKAPLAVFGGMIFIALIGLIVVFVYHCQREEPYLDAEPIPQGQPGRVPPPPPPPPG
jgi:hypothetical protein